MARLSASSVLLAAVLMCLALGATAITRVRIVTNMGTIEAELYEDRAPITVRNFVEYAQSGHYNGLIFHRVINGFMIQGGGYTPDFTERPTRPPIKNEANNGLLNRRGTLAMARTGYIHSATSQFFINHANNEFLDHGVRDFGYAVFGKVTKGMNIVDKIAALPTSGRGPFASDVPTTDVIIQRVDVL